jgi:hypothetical protein
MEGLQDLLIDTFIDQINNGEAPPALLNAARQLLKDNNITASITQESPLQALVNLLPFEDPADKVVNE